MAYFKTIVNGSLGAVEKWSCGISWGVFGLAPDSPDQAEVDGMLANLIGWTTTGSVGASLRALMSTQATIDGWRVEKRAEDETTLNVAQGLLVSPVPGTSTASKTPQDSLVLSLRTATPGPRGRGRLYWPAIGASLNTSFQMSSPIQATVATDAKAWLSAIGGQLNNYWIGIGSVRRAVLSVRSGTDHVCRDVNLIQVGSILDTQRRRRDTLPESYAATAYP